MQKTSSRRRFVTLVPIAGFAMLVACSKEPAPEPAPAPVAPPPPAPEPTPAAAPAAMPASEAAPEPSPATTPAAPATSAAMPQVDAKDPQAVALGYVSDAAMVDKAKYKTYVAGSHCATCALFQGQASDTEGGCPLFPGKHVAAKGWCSAWAKKA